MYCYKSLWRFALLASVSLTAVSAAQAQQDNAPFGVERSLPYDNELPDTLGRQSVDGQQPVIRKKSPSVNNAQAGGSGQSNPVSDAARKSKNMIDIERALKEAEAESGKAVVKKPGRTAPKQAVVTDNELLAPAENLDVSDDNQDDIEVTTRDNADDLLAEDTDPARAAAARRVGSGHLTTVGTNNQARGQARSGGATQPITGPITGQGQTGLNQRTFEAEGADPAALARYYNRAQRNQIAREYDQNATIFSYGDFNEGFRYFQDRRAGNAQNPYAPLGMRFGSFLGFSELQINGLYDSNPLATAGGDDDIALELRSNFLLQSDWSRHALQLETNGTYDFYKDFDEVNQKDLSIALRGRIDVTNQTSISLEGSYQTDTDDPGDLDGFSNGGELEDEKTLSFYGSLNHRYNHVFTRLGGRYIKNDFSGSSFDEATNSFVSNDDRNYDETGVSLRVGYEFFPGYAVFIDGDYAWYKYDLDLDRAGVNRDGKRYLVRAGLTKDFTPLITGTIAIGYGAFEPDDSTLENVDGLLVDANLTYEMSALTRLSLNARSGLDVSSIDGSGASFEHLIGLNLAHDFNWHLRGNLGASYQLTEYEGSNDEEEVLTLEAGLEYWMNREMSVRLNYRFEDHDLTGGDDYEQHQARLGVVLRR